MIDGKVERGTEKEDKYFQYWYVKSELLKATEKCYVALGHCRKASIGGVASDKAQPVTIFDNEGNLRFCLIHNGTIHNYKELAEKYIPDVKIDGMTDSQVMAHIFYYAGYDVLTEYIGGGAFVIQDYRRNKTFIFRGKSKAKQYSKEVTDERPLYFVQTGKSIIFSSIYAILQGLYWKFPVYDMPSNILLECDGNDIYEVKKYDRSECLQDKNTSIWINAEPEVKNTSVRQVDANKAAQVDFDIKTGTYFNSATGEELHGIVFVGPTGYISKYASIYSQPYYFWNGLMISGELAYNAVRDFHAGGYPANVVTNLARRLSCNPVVINKRFCTFTNKNKRVYFDDAYEFPLTHTEIFCSSHGRILVTSESVTFNTFVPVNLTSENVNKIVEYVKKSI